MTREEVLKQTAEIVCKDRDAQYGHPENNFELIAKMWSIWLGTEITASDVAMMMAMLKIARIKTGKTKEDNYIDLIGYIACMTEIDTPTEPTIKIAKPKIDMDDYPSEYHVSAKPRFHINDYKGKYAMHCDEKEKAKLFCNYLAGTDRKWHGGGVSYEEETYWRIYDNKTCYAFNDGEFARKEYYENDGYTILEFDNFDWR